MPSYRYDVFISYNHRDSDWVMNWLEPRLRRRNLSVYVYERDSEVGGSTLLNLEQALEQSRHILLVLTPNWIGSDWTKFESIMTQTADPVNLRRRILPIFLRECEIPSRLSIFTYADFRKQNDWDTQFKRVMQAIDKAKEQESK